MPLMISTRLTGREGSSVGSSPDTSRSPIFRSKDRQTHTSAADPKGGVRTPLTSAPIASEVLERIAGLYRIESEIRGLGVDGRRAARRDRSRPIIAALEPWLREKLGLISQKTKLAEAIRYALSRWQGLTRFLEDGRIEIDSNVVERAIRPIALNRKNAPFAGSDGGTGVVADNAGRL